MGVLKTASYGDLFGAAFAVGASFWAAMGVLGLLVAVASPQLFQMNGTPSGNSGQALGVLVVMLVVLMVLNTTIAAAGAGVWVFARRFLPREKTAT
ncbi:MAG: hypothetical protein E7812_17120 [Phenylobacterium sp.]|nr:MAG: hypothetical protein E7812_17120 [Phenylobacterium sp.]